MFSLDIESIPNPEMVGSLPEPEVAIGNLKNPELIKAKIAEAKESQIKKMALDPFYGRICSFATWSCEEIDQRFYTIDEISDAAEIGLINKLLTLLCVTSTTHPNICTWNGYEFDIPFIYKRAMMLRLDIPAGLYGLSRMCRRYSSVPHCDLMQEICQWNGRMKLDVAARALLGEGKTEGIDVTKFVEYIQAGRGNEIGIYNLKDAELTYKIYQRVSPYIF